ncbi:Soluble starch synthase [Actinidia chinensis var. chinensis]|uniref:Soluble starch synthase n=1 Tax=Actinidia chinensis var. chinensis TaxID=1590841 RepID=A0A2R6Q4B2_ACTCC|nr:Soluble starch synthase [Actinidia chinensis var. chinensis]
MADTTEEIPAATCSPPGEDPPVPATIDGGEKPKNKMERPKKRKKCPISLDKFEAINKQNLPNSSFSFTFDTKFSEIPEVTPKFGSFNSPELGPTPATSKSKATEEEEEEESGEVSVERREIVVETT